MALFQPGSETNFVEISNKLRREVVFFSAVFSKDVSKGRWQGQAHGLHCLFALN
jgi:hypothetical protein